MAGLLYVSLFPPHLFTLNVSYIILNNLNFHVFSSNILIASLNSNYYSYFVFNHIHS